MLNLAKVAILAVSNQIGHCTGFQLIFDGGTSTRLGHSQQPIGNLHVDKVFTYYIGMLIPSC